MLEAIVAGLVVAAVGTIGRRLWVRGASPRYSDTLQHLPPGVEAERVRWSRIDDRPYQAVRTGVFRQAEWRYRRGGEEFVLTWRE